MSLAVDSSSVDARTLAVSPERPWVAVFQLSMPCSTRSGWCNDEHGAFRNDLELGVGDDDAISSTRSESGFSPDISMSTQTRFFSL